MDRIDIHIDVPAVPQEELLAQGAGESSEAVRSRVTTARERQLARTIADLTGAEAIAARHVAEAVGFSATA